MQGESSARALNRPSGGGGEELPTLSPGSVTHSRPWASSGVNRTVPSWHLTNKYMNAHCCQTAMRARAFEENSEVAPDVMRGFESHSELKTQLCGLPP